MQTLNFICGLFVVIVFVIISIGLFKKKSWLFFTATSLMSMAVAVSLLEVTDLTRTNCFLYLLILESIIVACVFLKSNENGNSSDAFLACCVTVCSYFAITVRNVPVNEPIVCWFFASGVLVVAYLFITKDKLTQGFITLLISVFIFALGTSGVQQLLRTSLVSKVQSSLIDYATKLDSFQSNVFIMQDELGHQQKRIDGNQKELTLQQDSLRANEASISNRMYEVSMMQKQLETAQKCLADQQKKIENVEYLVNNLFSKTVFEINASTNSNQVIVSAGTNGWWNCYVKLKNTPIPQSIQLSVSYRGVAVSNFGTIPQSRNVLYIPLPPSWELNATNIQDIVFRTQYIKDTRYTNVFSEFKLQGTNIIANGEVLQFIEPKSD
jgi:hypothetical protein